MASPGNERRIELLNVDWAYDGYTGDYHKIYFLRNKSIAVNIGGVATVRLYGRVDGIRTQIGQDISHDTIIPTETLYDEIKATISSWTSGPVKVSILGE